MNPKPVMRIWVPPETCVISNGGLVFMSVIRLTYSMTLLSSGGPTFWNADRV